MSWTEVYTFSFIFPSAPSTLVEVFRNYYGPTMNAFEAAEKNDRASDLQKELKVLFNSQNNSPRKDTTSIPATFLRVTVARSCPGNPEQNTGGSP